jgi:chromosome segregation ATPase
MKTYQGELDDLNKDKLSLSRQLDQHNSTSKETEQRIEMLNKDIARKNKQIKEMTTKLEEQVLGLDKLKDKHRKDLGDLMSELEIKKDEHQKAKSQMEKDSEQFFAKECEYLAERDRREKMQGEYTTKLEQYEQVIREMEEELKEIQNRPSVEQWEEVCFENDLLKNRVEGLEVLLRDQGEHQQDQIVAEFKKYKINKEREMHDLEAEMENYGAKFHNLEENNYILKKDNNAMKAQLRTLMQDKMKMQKTIHEHEEDIKELRDEVSFYKVKREDHLNQLLNESYDRD